MKLAIQKAIIAHYSFLLSSGGLCHEQEAHANAMGMLSDDIALFGAKDAAAVAAVSLVGDATARWEVL